MNDSKAIKVLISARALCVLQLGGVLKDKAIKGSVLTLIRQSTENSLYHVTADFRSVAAASILAGYAINSRSMYHLICCNKLRHEHMVPVSFTYRKILEMEGSDINVSSLFEILRKNGLRATITRDEDRVLRLNGLANTMPTDYDEVGSELSGDVLARYVKSGLVDGLVKRTGPDWFGL